LARPKGHSFDKIDAQILRALLDDPNLTLEELGLIVNRKPSACKTRKDFLLTEGYLEFSAEIPAKRSRWKDIRLYFVTLPLSPKDESIDVLMAHIAAIPEIVWAEEVAGREYDIIIRVDSSDGVRFDEVRKQILAAVPGTTGHTVSIIKTLRKSSLPSEAFELG
jgi:DNA-binding Lrp family transcriptional regulator